MVETTIQTPSLRETTVQRRWIDKQNGHAEALHGPGSTNRQKAHKHALLLGRSWRTQSDLRLSMVHSEPAEDRLGTRMDRYNTTTPHSSKCQRSKTTIQPKHTQPTRSSRRRSPLHWKNRHQFTDRTTDNVIHACGRARQTPAEPYTNRISP